MWIVICNFSSLKWWISPITCCPASRATKSKNPRSKKTNDPSSSWRGRYLSSAIVDRQVELKEFPQNRPNSQSHNAPVPRLTIHHIVTEMCTCVYISATKWCIKGYLSDALWDSRDGSIPLKYGRCKVKMYSVILSSGSYWFEDDQRDWI